MEQIFNKVLNVVKRATNLYFNKSYYEREDKHKFDNDDVTNRDISTQKYLQIQLSKILPGSNFVGEEGSVSRVSPYTWIVDPIDGTFNYKHGVGLYGTQVVLLKDGKAIFSCFYLPNYKQMFYATPAGAFLNGKKISVSGELNLKDMGVNIGDFQLDYKNTLKKQKEIMFALCDKVKRIRMFGSSCFDSCMLSHGAMDVYIVYILNKWDLVPGDYLIRQAGGVMFKNKDNNIFIYGNQKNVEKVVEQLKDIDSFHLSDSLEI